MRIVPILTVSSTAGSAKPSILVVEDDALIALDLAMQVEDMGYDVIGPFHNVSSALARLEEDLPDAAILDFNLSKNETSTPIAERLIFAGVPLTFLSGYSPTDFLEMTGLTDQQVLCKPVNSARLKDTLKRLIATRR